MRVPCSSALGPLLALLCGCSSVGDAVLDVSAPLKQPESALHDPSADVYLISNVSGAPLERNNQGFITRLSPEGKVLAERFIAGGQKGVELHAPKGMALVSDVLFVSDIDHVRLFSASTGAFIAAHKIEGAEFLNDVLALPDGHVLVSDMAKNRIVRVSREGEISTWAEGPQLGGANGLALAANHVWVAGFADGHLSQLSLDGAVVSRRQVEGELDGLIAQGPSVLVSSWSKKAVLRVGPGDEVKVLLRGLESPADIGFDAKRKRVLVPMMMKDRLLVFGLD